MQKFVIHSLVYKKYLSHYDEVLRINSFKRALADALTFNSKLEAEALLENYSAPYMFSIVPVEIPFNESQGLVQTQLELGNRKEVKETETLIVMCPDCQSTDVFTHGRFVKCAGCGNRTKDVEEWDVVATKIEGEDENGKFIQLTVRL